MALKWILSHFVWSGDSIRLLTDSRGERPTGQPATAGSGTSAADLAASFAPPAETPPLDAGSAQNMQDRKLAFVNAEADRRTVSPDRVQEKASSYVVQAGTVIPAASSPVSARIFRARSPRR